MAKSKSKAYATQFTCIKIMRNAYKYLGGRLFKN